jgi:hypothetical protein
MKVKLLLFPLSIIVALALAIFWIQPEFTSALSLRDQKNAAEAQLAQIDRVIANIDALDRSLTENAGNEQFVKTYLPKTGSDDVIIDEVNFLAGESGLLLVSTGLKPISSEIVQAVTKEAQAAADRAELATASPGSLINTGASPVGTGITFVSSSPKARVRSTEVSVAVFGKYDQIKAFIDRVYHADHFQNFVSVAVAQNAEKQASANSAPAAPDMLNATIVIRFGVLPETAISRGVFLKTFDIPTFDLAVVSDLRGRVTAELPILDAMPSERPNPFLR